MPDNATRFRPLLALQMGLRSLRRSPASTFVAVGALALGLAAPATFFSFLVGATRPLPVPEGDRVVRVDVLEPSRDGRPLSVLERDLVDLRGSDGLAALGGFRTYGGTLVDARRSAIRFAGAELTPDVLPLLRVSPSMGRIPDGSAADNGILISDDLWEELYGRDSEAMGTPVTVNGAPFVIVGVMPPGFGFPFNHNLWSVREPSPTGTEPLELVGRLADGVDVGTATTEIASRWMRGDSRREVDRAGGVAQVRGFTGGRGEGGEAVAFGGLVLVALCLLVIACSNVANLLLVRATERVRALAIQAAVGAGRLQIAAQLLSEAVLLAIAGGLVGLGMALIFVEAIQRGVAEEHFGYFWMRLAVDGPVLAFVAVLVLGTALLAGLLPVARVLKVDVQSVLKEEGSSGAVRGGGTWGHAFVTGQLALSCAALVAAGLTGFALSGSGDFGSDLPSDEVLIASISLDTETSRVERDADIEALLQGLSARSRVTGAGAALGAPGYGELSSPIRMDGRSDGSAAAANTLWNAVGPDFFSMFDLDLRAGRRIEASDAVGTAPIAVVNESFVRRFSAEEPILGRTLLLPAADTATWFTVVGVVEDATLSIGERSREDRVYLALSQVSATDVMLLTRAEDPGVVAGELRRTVATVDPSIPVSGVRTLADAHAFMIRIPRLFGMLALGGGAAGFLVAAVGLYGLLAFRVRQRKGDLGVRLALGADGARLAREVVSWAMRLLLPAVVVGLTLAWVASPILSVALFGADPRAPGVYALVGLTFLGVGVLAALAPAARAAATDPVGTLRGG